MAGTTSRSDLRSCSPRPVQVGESRPVGGGHPRQPPDELALPQGVRTPDLRRGRDRPRRRLLRRSRSLLPSPRGAGRGAKAILLRLAPTRNGQRACLNHAAEFEFDGAVAQLEERRAGSAKAGGSSPPSSTPSKTEVGCHQFRNHFGFYLERASAGEGHRDQPAWPSPTPVLGRSPPRAAGATLQTGGRVDALRPSTALGFISSICGGRARPHPTDRAGASPQSCSSR